MSFDSLEIETNPDAIREGLYDQLAAAFPGWEPAEGNLEVWIARWMAEVVPDLAELVVQYSDEFFYGFGEEIIGLPPIAAATAKSTATITFVDNAGYTLPQGTQLEVAVTGSDKVGFRTMADATAPPGSTAVSVAVETLLEGDEGNGLEGEAQPVAALAYVDSVELDAPAAGGTAAEDPSDYRNRLIEELRLQAPRPIIPEDFAIIARRVAGVARSTAIDGYNPDDDTSDNERMITVAVADEAGEPLSAPAKAAIEALLEAYREINFVVHVIDPTYTEIKVDVDVVALPGYAAAAVDAAVTAALEAFLDPARWGQRDTERESFAVWSNTPVAYRNDLIWLVRNVPGVGHVADLQLAKEGNALGTADVTLDGVAPLAQPGTITVDVT